MVRHPDQEQRETAEVDVLVTIGRHEFAVEHTVLEASERVIENYESVFVAIRERLEKTFPEGLPSQVGYYYLVLPVEVAFRDGKRARQKALKCLLGWIRRNADALDDESQTNYDLPGPGRGAFVAPQKLGFKIRRPQRDAVTARASETVEQPRDPEISLRRWRASRDGLPHPAGSLKIIRSLPEDTKEARRQRLRRAFSDKCPKLRKWAERGARTVLVLESENPLITEPMWLADEIAKLVEKRNDAPSEVVLVEFGRTKWSACVLNQEHENKWSPKLAAGYHEDFPEAELTDL